LRLCKTSNQLQTQNSRHLCRLFCFYSITWRSSTAARPLALDRLALDAAQLDGRQASGARSPADFAFI